MNVLEIKMVLSFKVQDGKDIAKLNRKIRVALSDHLEEQAVEMLEEERLR